MDRHHLPRLAALAAVMVLVVLGLGRLAASDSVNDPAFRPGAVAPPTGAAGPQATTERAESRSLRTREGAVAAATTYALALDNGEIFDAVHRAAVLDDIAADATRTELAAAFNEGLGLISSQLHLEEDSFEDPASVWRSVPGGWRLTEYDRNAATVAVWTAVMAIADGRLLAEPGWRTTEVTLAWERDAWRLVGFGTGPGPDPGEAVSDLGSTARRINTFEAYHHWPATGSRGAGR